MKYFELYADGQKTIRLAPDRCCPDGVPALLSLKCCMTQKGQTFDSLPPFSPKTAGCSLRDLPHPAAAAADDQHVAVPAAFCVL
jgi:hypothetical protein